MKYAQDVSIYGNLNVTQHIVVGPSDKSGDSLNLSNDSSISISLIDTSIAISTDVEYQAQRSVYMKKGSILFIYDTSTSTLHMDDAEYSQILDIGLTFDGDVSNGIIQLIPITSNNSMGDIDFKYELKILK